MVSSQTSNLFAIIIVNSIKPYCYELNNVLSLPSGFTYRFRYQKKKKGEWMPEIPNPKQLKGCKALVVLREFSVTAKLIPIRKILITKVVMIGDIVYIEYELDERIIFSSDILIREKQLEVFNQRILTDINTSLYPNIPGEDLRNLVFFGTDYTYDFKDDDYKGDRNDEDSNRWGNLLELIGSFNGTGIDEYKDFDFMKITGVFDENGNPARILRIKNKSFFVIYNRKVYAIQFLQRTFTGSIGSSAVTIPRDVVLVSDPNEVKLLTPRLNISGKYDLLSLVFRPEISRMKRNTFLMLQFYKGNEALPFPSITIPIQIRHSFIENMITFSSVIIFIVASVIYWFSDSFAAPGFSQIVRNALLPIMIVSGGEFLRIIKDFILSKASL
jgi:hypothetical protein